MEGLVVAIFILVVLAYLLKNGSESPSKTTIKLNLQSPKTNAYPNPTPPTTTKSTNTNSSPGNKTSYSTTGEFTRSTEGFIPKDKCECGGQWVKHVNKSNGGRFFGCSRYPSCDNTRDKQQAKNFCSNGHARTSQNTHYNSDGSRRCLICKPLPKDACSNGHERTSQNTDYNSDGSRRCLICRPLPEESSDSDFRGPNKRRTPSRPISHDTNLYCRNGHKRTTENTYVRPNGERECGICRKNARK